MTLYGVSLIGLFLVFARTASWVMILPGFSGAQVPMQFRLYIAFALTVCIAFILDNNLNFGTTIEPSILLGLIGVEMAVGAVLALPIRFLFMALSFLGEFVTQIIGLNPIPGTPIGDTQPSTVLSSTLNIAALTIMFSSGMHMHFIFGMADSFTVFPVGAGIDVSLFTENLVDNLNSFFSTMMRLCAPFLVYAVIMNLVAGLINKLTPAVPIYFVSAPFVIGGGIFLLIFIGDDILFLFHLELVKLVNEIF
ncbi:MAG: flagellar biosynthetic protein FliR [Nitratireductor sp.]